MIHALRFKGENYGNNTDIEYKIRRYLSNDKSMKVYVQTFRKTKPYFKLPDINNLEKLVTEDVLNFCYQTGVKMLYVYHRAKCIPQIIYVYDDIQEVQVAKILRKNKYYESVGVIRNGQILNKNTQ